MWPPLYPSILAALVLLGLDLRWCVWLVNAFAAFGIMSAIALLLRVTVERKLFLALGIIACAVLHPVLELLSEVRTDALFFAFYLHSIVGATAWLRGNARGLGYGLAFAALASITKYQGLAVLGGWGLLILWQTRPRSIGESAMSLGLLTLAAIPLTLWLTRNFFVTGGLVGSRPVPTRMSDYLSEVMPRVADSVTNWFLPQAIPLFARVLIMFGLLLVLAVSLRVVLRDDQSNSRAASATIALTVFSATYCLFTLASSSASSAWGVPRYMAILAPTVSLLAIIVLDRLASQQSMRLTMWIVPAVAVVLLAVPVARSTHLAKRILEGRPGYQYGDWFAAIRPEIRNFKFDGAVLSNEEGLVWTVARVPSRGVERSTWQKWREAGPVAARESMLKYARTPSPLMPGPANQVYFVEVFKPGGEGSISAADLAEVFHMVPMVQVADGAIWLIE